MKTFPVNVTLTNWSVGESSSLSRANFRSFENTIPRIVDRVYARDTVSQRPDSANAGFHWLPTLGSRGRWANERIATSRCKNERTRYRKYRSPSAFRRKRRSLLAARHTPLVRALTEREIRADVSIPRRGGDRFSGEVDRVRFDSLVRVPWYRAPSLLDRDPRVFTSLGPLLSFPESRSENELTLAYSFLCAGQPTADRNEWPKPYTISRRSPFELVGMKLSRINLYT